jgi:2-polyprenyl-3-methyl-5-hydroxy-6-metoxy-1,4-benzoquinol methylase
MLPSADVIRADFHRSAAQSPDVAERVEPAAQRLVAEVPLRSRVLEIGCGTGTFARELANKRGAKITAIDLAPRMIDVARVRTAANLGIDFRVADFMELSPRGFDVVVAIDTLHHLPIAVAAERMAQAVVPGGLVIITDGFARGSALELPYSGLSWLVHKQPQRGDRSLREVRAILRDALPGVAVHRHLGWRYTAIWRKPA